MNYHKRWAFLAAIVAGLSCSVARADDAPPVEECPGATSWERERKGGGEAAHADGEQTPAVSEVALLEELKLRVEKDQAARKRWLADKSSAELTNAVDSIDSANLAWLQKLISEKGFPTAAQVGKKGVHFAWVLLQHADKDPKLQSDLVPILEQRFTAGELPGNDLARITDRVLLASGKPQRYGTQFDWFAGDFALPEPSTLAETDAARARLGLMPLLDYVCTLRKARNAAMTPDKSLERTRER